MDHAFGLEFHEGEQCICLRIEGAFTLRDGEGEARLSASMPGELDGALGLFGQTVRSATASLDGTLQVVFEGGRVVLVPPDPDYEAWEMVGNHGMRVVCLPGGSLAVWQATGSE